MVGSGESCAVSTYVHPGSCRGSAPVSLTRLMISGQSDRRTIVTVLVISACFRSSAGAKPHICSGERSDPSSLRCRLTSRSPPAEGQAWNCLCSLWVDNRTKPLKMFTMLYVLGHC